MPGLSSSFEKVVQGLFRKSKTESVQTAVYIVLLTFSVTSQAGSRAILGAIYHLKVAPKTPVRFALTPLRTWWPLGNPRFSPERDYVFRCHKLIFGQLIDFHDDLVAED